MSTLHAITLALVCGVFGIRHDERHDGLLDVAAGEDALGLTSEEDATSGTENAAQEEDGGGRRT